MEPPMDSINENVWDVPEEELEDVSFVVGIDLGTTNSCISFWNPAKGRCKTIKHTENKYDTLPSIALISRTGDGLPAKIEATGYDALVAMKSDSKREKSDKYQLIDSAKRVIGRSADDKTVKHARLILPYAIRQKQSLLTGDGAGKYDQIVVGFHTGQDRVDEATIDHPLDIDNKTGISVIQISSAILGALKQAAEEKLDRSITHAVVTIPAYFTENQKRATKAAAEAAGFIVLKLLTEPMAAAMSYGLFVAGTKKVVIFDFGGGTLDLSILSIANGTFKTLAIGGENMLGGDDFDVELMKLVLRKISERLQLATIPQVATLSSNGFQDLKTVCEQTKCLLSHQESANLKIELANSDIGIDKEPNTMKQFEFEITRVEFEQASEALLEKCRVLCRSVLNDSKLDRREIAEVVLVGGSTKIPIVQSLLQQEFETDELCVSVSGSRAVAEGAAIQGAILAGADKRNLSKVLMFDATPYSLGLEDSNGMMQVMIERNTQFPVSKTLRFRTSRDYQPAVTVDVFEGEEPVAHDNNWLGCYDFVVPNGSRFKAGERSIEVTFSITKNGVLAVHSSVPKDEREVAEPSAARDITDDDETVSLRDSLFLVAFLGCLVVLYVVLRMGLVVEKEDLHTEL